jgi:NAD(P)-dependent dehydrogenase (short-subunit alcohol dehydrogenase family)
MHDLSVTIFLSYGFLWQNAGATNGIGKETARVLALRGAKVIIPARTLESGLKLKESLADEVPSSKVHVMEMDLSCLSSVRDFARSFNSSHKHLNLLMYVPIAVAEPLSAGVVHCCLDSLAW